MSQAMRWVSTRVLPLPAPASTSTGPSAAVTAARCASFSGLRIGDKSMGGAFYTLKARAYGNGRALILRRLAPKETAALFPRGPEKSCVFSDAETLAGGAKHDFLGWVLG